MLTPSVKQKNHFKNVNNDFYVFVWLVMPGIQKIQNTSSVFYIQLPSVLLKCIGSNHILRSLADQHKIAFQLKKNLEGTCVAQLVERWTLGFDSGHDLMGRGIEPLVGLHAQCGVCLTLSLGFSPGSCFLSLSKKNK